MQGLLRVVSEAQHLQSLGLDVEPFDDYDLNAGIFRYLATARHSESARPFRHLQALELRHHNIELDFLVKFVEEHKNTLPCLQLYNIGNGSAKHPDFEEPIRAAAREEGFHLQAEYCFS